MRVAYNDSDDRAGLLQFIKYTYNSMFVRLGTDYELRNQWFLAILDAVTTNLELSQ